jgi:magnesium chelatase subunit D
VADEDVRQAALLALPHRRRRNPFDAPGLDPDMLDEALGRQGGDFPPEPPPEPPDGGPGSGGAPEPGTVPAGAPAGSAAAPAAVGDGTGGAAPPGSPARAEQLSRDRDFAVGELFRTRLLTVPGVGEGAAGRRSRAETTAGRTTGARRPRGPLHRLHLTATLRAAAPHQLARGRDGSGLVLRGDDLRQAVREGREGNLVLFVVDASGSMAARRRMTAVKGAVLSLLLDAYQRRDKVGLITFRGDGAELALPPTSSVETGAARLRTLPSGGRTPLAAGLLKARDVLRVEGLRDPRRRSLLVVVTDGRATHGADPVGAARRAAVLLASGAPRPAGTIVVDCEDGPVRLGMAVRLAEDLRGVALRLDDLAADGLTQLVSDRLGRRAGRAA